MGDAVKGAFVVFVGLLVIAGITVGGYLGGWWLQGDMTNRQAHIDRQNYGSQLAYQNKVADNISTISDIDVQINNPNASADEKSSLTAQKAAVVSATCKTYVLIVDPPADEQQWAAVHCN